MPGTGNPRDPVSVLFDRSATAILHRAYRLNGSWYSTRIFDPQPAHLIYFRRTYDIDVTGPDNASTISGRHNNYRTRWNRGFIRSVWHWNKPKNGGLGRPLQIQIGRPKPAGPGIPAGWAVRVRVRAGGRRAMRAVDRKDERDRIWVGDGEKGGRFADPAGQDWH